MVKIEIFIAKINLHYYLFTTSIRLLSMKKRSFVEAFFAVLFQQKRLHRQLFAFLSKRKKPTMMEIKLNTSQQIAPIESDTTL